LFFGSAVNNRYSIFGLIRERGVKGDQVIGAYYELGLCILGGYVEGKGDSGHILEMVTFLHLFYEQALQ